jgi:acetyltransferase-like isoleucine patch superfamily enzyme
MKNQDSPFYAPEELRALGFDPVGRNTQVSRLARFYGVRGSIGDHSRIDDFAIIKGNIAIGSYVHISAFCLLGGTGGQIRFEDFSGVAAYVAVYTATDDYASPLLTNAVVPADLRKSITGDVHLGRGCMIGAHAIVLPSTVLEPYVTVGALCIVQGSLREGGVYVASGGKPRLVTHRDMESIRSAEAELMRRWREPAGHSEDYS